MLNCKHYACRSCLESYLTIEIFESRTEIACTQCSDAMHPSDIEALLRTSPTIMKKYEDFMVRRVLLSDPDSRWCPAPDCRLATHSSDATVICENFSFEILKKSLTFHLVMLWLQRDVRHVLELNVSVLAVMWTFATIVKPNGIRIKRVMQHVPHGKVQCVHHREA